MKRLNSFARILCAILFVVLGSSLSNAVTINWIGGTGDWNAAANWSTGALPGPDDDVVIDLPGDIMVTHSTGTHTVRSLRSEEAFVLSGGTLTASTTLRVNNIFTLSGGELDGASVSSDRSIVATSGTVPGNVGQ